MNRSSRQLKRQLIASIVSVCVTLVALTSATYAWYVVNNKVEGTTTTISATTNGFILQIAEASKGAQHGDNNQSLSASSEGGKISPSSTDDMKTWYVCQGMNGEGKVTSYLKPSFVADGKPGQYGSADDPHYAFIKSEYILYTITETGYADVYLDSSENESPVEVTWVGTPTTDTISRSMRVGITVQPVDKAGKDTGTEELKVVYAPYEEKADSRGNDAEAIGGWSCIGADTDGKLKPMQVTYPYIYEKHCIDQNGHNWTATKNGEAYEVTPDSKKIAARVGYDGVKVRVYIWMEGTDSDCVNNEAAEDPATYNVTVHFAGVAAGE